MRLAEVAPGAVERRVTVAGTTLAVTDVGSGPPVVLAHGFPELSWSWRHQVEPLVRAGFRVLVPDMRGYGDSDSPAEVSSYGGRALTGDLVGLLDDIGAERGVFVGHDWGAQVVWWLAQLHPDRVRGVAALSVAFTPRPTLPPLERLRAWAGDRFFYWLYFQEPGVAEAELSADPRRFLAAMLYSISGDAPATGMASLPAEGTRFGDQLTVPEVLPAWLSDADLDVYTEAFRRTGFRGPLGYYRAADLTWADLPELGERQVEAPALFVAGDRDPVLAFTSTRHLERWVPRLSASVSLPGVGHWTQQEAPGAVTRALLGWLAELPTA